MPDEGKRDENVQKFDQEPASGTLNDDPNTVDDTEQRATSAWGGSAPVEPEKDDTTDSSHVESSADREETKREDGRAPLDPIHADIQPATIPMSTRPREAAPDKPVETDADELPKPGPGLMVLQWLTYAFWGWTVLSLSGLILIVVAGLLNQHASDWIGGIAYLLAAVIVLFVISLVTDVFYAKAEKRHARTSGTSVIMIIHAVLFALFAIGSLIAAVFGLVSLLISDTSGSTGPLTGIISGSIIAVIYGLTLLRTLRPRWIKSVVPMYWALMSLAVIVTVALAVIGPVAQAKLQNEDRVVEQGTPDIARAVNSYANRQAKLPRSLNDLTSVSADAKTLIDENNVTYTPGNKIESNAKKTNVPTSTLMLQTPTPVFHYKLCVNYKAKDDTSSDYASYRPDSSQLYPTTVSTYGHPAGHVCYDLQTDYIYNY